MCSLCRNPFSFEKQAHIVSSIIIPQATMMWMEAMLKEKKSTKRTKRAKSRLKRKQSQDHAFGFV